MNKTRSALGIRESLGEERASSYCLSPMVRWFKLIAITILCLSCKAFVMNTVGKLSILVFHVHSWVYCFCVKEEHDIGFLPHRCKWHISKQMWMLRQVAPLGNCRLCLEFLVSMCWFGKPPNSQTSQLSSHASIKKHIVISLPWSTMLLMSFYCMLAMYCLM